MKQEQKSLIFSSLSAVIQYYDYHLFGFLASSIAINFTAQSADITLALMKTYLMMFIAVCAKPLGAIILGRIGDIYGRQAAINISIICMAFASLGISIIPSYEIIGIFSLILLLSARMLICACASSGSDGVRIYIYEKLGQKRQNLSVSIATVLTIIGSFSAAFSAYVFTLEVLPSYFWRFAFALGGLSGIILVLVRKFLVSKQEEEIKKEVKYTEYKSMPLYKIIKENLYIFLLGVVMAGCIGSSYQFCVIFFGTYSSKILKIIGESDMKYYTSVAVFIYMISVCVAGFIADIISNRLIATLAGCMLLGLSIINAIYISDLKISIKLYLAIVGTLPFILIPSLSIFKGSIPIVIRYRMFSLSHAIGSIVISAPTALIGTFLYHKTQIGWLPILYFIVIIFAMILALNMLASIKKVDPD